MNEEEFTDKEIFENLVDRYGTSWNPVIDSFLKIDRERLKREHKLSQ